MPLLIAPIETPLTIRKMRLEGKELKRLLSLGVYEGAEIELVSSQGGAAVILVKDSRLALDAEISRSILVSVAA